jgi:DNA-binding NarL/FixJ family response regulator
MKAQGKKTRILVVDDHPIATRGICMVIAGEDDMEVCGTATTPAEAIRQYNKLKPDMAILDLRLGEQSGIDLVRDLLAQDKSFPTLLFSMYDDHLYAERAIRAGARGYVMKHETATTVVEAIRTVRDGNIYMRKELARQALDHGAGGPTPYSTAQLAKLTDRELQVLQAIGDGRNRKEVAAEINVSVKTLDGYRRSMVQKLELRDVTELAQLATRLSETGHI